MFVSLKRGETLDIGIQGLTEDDKEIIIVVQFSSKTIDVIANIEDFAGDTGCLWSMMFPEPEQPIEVLQKPFYYTWTDVELAIGTNIHATDEFRPMSLPPEQWDTALPGLPIKCEYQDNGIFSIVEAYIGIKPGVGVTLIGVNIEGVYHKL